MKKADVILKNALVLTMDEEYTEYEPGAIVISNENILAVGTQDDICKEYQATEEIDCTGKVLMPGLVNTHTHVPMTLLRGLADDLRLDVWLMGYIMPVEREFVSPEFVKLGTKLACAEMIRSGVTTFVDMYYFEDDIAKATEEAGMRAICGESILKYPTPDAHSYEESLAYCREFIQNWKDHPLIIATVAPHAPYTCTEEILQKSAEMAIEFDVPLIIHLAETAIEVKNMRAATGMPVIPYIKKQDVLNAKVIGAHCVHIDEGEMHTLLHYGSGVAHNPSSNMKLASGIANTKRMLEIGLNVGIGTDGPASNNDLDMFEEIRLATFLAKVSSGDPTALDARTTLAMATRIGAKSIHLGHLIGTIEPGKRADITIVDISPVHNAPRFYRDSSNGAYAQLVYASKASDVSDVMVNGKWLMRDHQLLTLNESSLIEQSKVYAKQIDEFLYKREESIISKLIAIGGALEEESFEVQSKVPIDNPTPFIEKILNSDIEIIYQRHYREYDVYFSFSDPEQGFLRYREDHFVNKKNEIEKVRSRLTLIGPRREKHYPQKVLLSRSRYLAPATQSLRFYREYFKPEKQDEIDKDRRRFLVKFKDTEFYINIDTLEKPELGYYLEVKSRTWSRRDAEHKSQLVSELIQYLGASSEESVSVDYIKMVQDDL